MHQHILIALQFEIAVIVTKKVVGAFFRGVGIGEIVEIEAFFGESNAVHRHFSLRIQLH